MPVSIAFWILSLGIDASRAFCTAVPRDGFPSMSPPPSRAATVIARASLEKSLPRFASAAPFLCLIDDHLECPDIQVSFYWRENVLETAVRSIGRNLAATAVFLAMLLAAFSLWTLIPLGWVYIASKLAHSQFPSIGPYMVVIVGIILTVLADAWLIGRLNDLYVRVTGSNRLVASRPGWMKSMRDAAPVRGSVTVVEAVMMSSVMLAAVALITWFFLLAGSPIPTN